MAFSGTPFYFLSITKTCPCNKQIFLALKIENIQLKMFDIFLIFAQNIDCGYTLEPPRQAVLTRTHILCFGAKIRKIGIPCISQFCCIKVFFKGVFMARTCFHDALVTVKRDFHYQLITWYSVHIFLLKFIQLI